MHPPEQNANPRSVPRFTFAIPSARQSHYLPRPLALLGHPSIILFSSVRLCDVQMKRLPLFKHLASHTSDSSSVEGGTSHSQRIMKPATLPQRPITNLKSPPPSIRTLLPPVFTQVFPLLSQANPHLCYASHPFRLSQDKNHQFPFLSLMFNIPFSTESVPSTPRAL